MPQVHAYLFFGGNCREAMSFYQECLGGELNLMTVADSPVSDKMPAEAAQAIMHGNLVKDGTLLMMASDMMGDELSEGNNVALSVSCGSEEETYAIFNKLAEGGNVTHPLQIEFWGALFGHLTDKFGINWMLSYDKNMQG